MVSRAGRYYGTPFKVHRGVTQGYPLSPTVFNMVVDSVNFHWVMLLVGGESGPDGFGRLVQWMAEFFYADDRPLTLPRLSRLQVASYVLTGLFYRVGLHTNINKIVGMVCQPCHIVGVHLEMAYMRRITGVGPYFWE